ncbi:MAG: diacylglycerol kinase family lipid kinase [Alphaproteobacteria bacterium]
MTVLRLVVIYNPVAGRRRPGFFDATLSALLRHGCTVELRETTGPGDATRLADTARAEGFERIVVAGGDGTINEVVNGLAQPGPEAPPLAVIPLGTANVLARELGLPTKPDQLARVIAAGEAKPVALGRAGERHFTLMAGAGFDAWVVNSVDSKLKARFGKGAYVLMSLWHILTYRRRLYAVDIDGQPCMAASVVVSNARHYGGPFVIAPAADLSQPSLQVCLFEHAGRWHAIRYSVALLTGRLAKLADVRLVEGNRVRISGREAGEPVQLDGDIVADLPCEIAVRRDVLRLVYPRFAAPDATVAPHEGNIRRAEG